jgi:hypothetical protein
MFKTIIDNMFYREGDNGASAGAGIPAAPAVTADVAPAGAASAAGIPPAVTKDTTPSAPVDDDAPGEPRKFSINDTTGATFDDIPYTDDDRAAPEPVAAKTEETPITDAAPVEAKADDTPTAPVVDAPLSETSIAALRIAADALGINETDPALIPAAIEARKTEIAAEQTRQREAQELAFEQKAIEGLQEKARTDVALLLNPLVRAQLRDEQFDVDNAPDDWWKSDSPDFDRNMTERYNQIFNQIRVQPQYEKAYLDAFNGYKGAFDAEKAQVSEIATKYPLHPSGLIQQLRLSGVSPQGLQTVAREIHEHTQKAIATSNSAIAADRAELARLRAQVSGHDAALAKARTDGATEEKNRLAKELARGERETPATVGVGGLPAGPKKFSIHDEITYDKIPWADQRPS